MSDALRTRRLMAGFLASSAIHVVVALWISGAVVVRVVPVGSHSSTSVAAMSERPAAASRLTPRPHAEEPGAGADDGGIVETIASFTNRARSYAAQLANHLWQSTLFAIAVALVTMAFRNNRARVRYGLWLSASAKFFIPFSILTALGSTVSWTAVAPADAASTPSAMVQISQTFLETASSGLSPAIPTPGSANWVLVAALGVWACGLIGIAFARLRMWRRIRAMVQTSVAIDLPNMPAGVYARVASGLLEPAVIGICRPILLLPAGIERHLTAPQLDAVLTHELCHMQRRDNLTAAMHMVVETMFWFHPFVWWIGARLVDERERACDEEVLRTCAEPRAYADGILNICRRYVEARLACVSGVTGSDLKKRIEAIMRNQPGDVVASWKKIALIGLTVSVLAVPFGVGVMTASPDSSQSPAADSSPLAFEVVSVRPNRSGNGGGPFGPQPGGRFAATNVTLGFLVRFAYESSPWNRALDPFQVSGGPSWVTSDRFDVNAKAATDVTLPQMRRMVQAMLADRFKLRSHVEKRELPVYRLVLARSDRAPAAQLRRTALDCTRPQNPFSGFNPDEGVPCGYFGMSPTINPASGQSNQAFRGMTMEGLASNLRPFLGRTVVDGTGLIGHYDGDFEFTAEIVLPPPPPGLPNPYEGRVFPSIFSVLPQQLGLRLESARGPVDVLVIDSAEPPTEN